MVCRRRPPQWCVCTEPIFGHCLVADSVVSLDRNETWLGCPSTTIMHLNFSPSVFFRLSAKRLASTGTRSLGDLYDKALYWSPMAHVCALGATTEGCSILKPRPKRLLSSLALKTLKLSSDSHALSIAAHCFMCLKQRKFK